MTNESRNAGVAIEYFKILQETGSRAEANASLLLEGRKIEPHLEPRFLGSSDWKMAPKTHVVNGHSVPAPLSQAPTHGAEYWTIPNDAETGCGVKSVWYASPRQCFLLARNKAFESEEAAMLNDEAAYQYGRFAKGNK